MQRTVLSYLAVAGAAVALGGLLVAGPLDPPAGPVTSTYKTLTEVEPRIPIGPTTTPGDATSMFRITQPGSYYLTGNVIATQGRHGVTVNASHVTIDLSGYALDGSGSTTNFASGLHTTTTARNVVVKNGTIRNFRGYGIIGNFEACELANLGFIDNVGGQLELGGSEDCIARHIRVQTTGGETGIQLGANAVIEDCVVRGAGTGIYAQSGVISRCSVIASGSNGIAINRGAVLDCSVQQIPASGAVNSGAIQISGGRVERCVVSSCAVGLSLSGTATVSDCEFITCTTGLRAGPFGGVGCRIEGNTFSGCLTVAVLLQTTGHMVVGNRLRNNATDIDAIAGNVIGEVLSFEGGGTLTRENSHPGANITY